MSQVFDALISLLPIESETYRRRRNVAESGRMYSSFDELVGRLRHFDCAETAKFDVLCCVMNCVVCFRARARGPSRLISNVFVPRGVLLFF